MRARRRSTQSEQAMEKSVAAPNASRILHSVPNFTATSMKFGSWILRRKVNKAVALVWKRICSPFYIVRNRRREFSERQGDEKGDKKFIAVAYCEEMRLETVGESFVDVHIQTR